MKTIIFLKNIFVGKDGLATLPGNPVDVDDDKEAQGYIDGGLAEAAPAAPAPAKGK